LREIGTDNRSTGLLEKSAVYHVITASVKRDGSGLGRRNKARRSGRSINR